MGHATPMVRGPKYQNQYIIETNHPSWFHHYQKLVAFVVRDVGRCLFVAPVKAKDSLLENWVLWFDAWPWWRRWYEDVIKFFPNTEIKKTQLNWDTFGAFWGPWMVAVMIWWCLMLRSFSLDHQILRTRLKRLGVSFRNGFSHTYQFAQPKLDHVGANVRVVPWTFEVYWVEVGKWFKLRKDEKQSGKTPGISCPNTQCMVYLPTTFTIIYHSAIEINQM